MEVTLGTSEIIYQTISIPGSLVAIPHPCLFLFDLVLIFFLLLVRRSVVQEEKYVDREAVYTRRCYSCVVKLVKSL